MKTHDGLPATAFLFAAALTLAGCKTPGVVAVTGTNLGIELSYDTTRQTPQGIVGYKRAEYTYSPILVETVPPKGTSSTGRVNTSDESIEITNPAVVSPLAVEFGANALLSSKASIAQRIAIGTDAVRSTGVMAMFARSQGDKPGVDLAALEKAAAKEKEATAAVAARVAKLQEPEADSALKALMNGPVSDSAKVAVGVASVGGDPAQTLVNAVSANAEVRDYLATTILKNLPNPPSPPPAHTSGATPPKAK